MQLKLETRAEPSRLMGWLAPLFAAVLTLIAVDNTSDAWVQVLVYAAVVITVVSGADYFLNVRRRLEEARTV